MEPYDIRRLYRLLMNNPEVTGKFEAVKRNAKIAFVLIALSELLSIAGVYPLKMMLDGFSNDSNSVYLYFLAVFGFMLSFSHSVEQQFMDRIRSWVVYRNYGYILGYSHEHQLSKDTSWHVENSTGEKDSVLSKNMRKVDRLMDIVVFDVLPTFLTVVLISLGLLLIGWQYSVLALGTMAMYLIVAARNERKFRPWREEAHRLDKAYLSFGAEQIKNWPLIRNFGLVARESQSYRQVIDAFTHSEDRRRKIRMKQWIGQNSVMNTSQLILWSYLVWQYSQGQMSIGNAVLITAWFAKIYADMYRFSNFQREGQEGVEALAELIKMLTTESRVVTPDNAISVDGLDAEIVFDNVCFYYDGNDDPALSGITAKIPVGSMVAVVGESGSGKSTLTSLLKRDYDPTQGCIFIGGIDLRQIDITGYLQDMFSIVPQDPMLCDGTIASNIRFGYPDASDAEVIAAAKMADAHNFIVGFADGYASRVGEDGVRLSGGQKQRIAIAMALVKNPRLLILDEATSSLDEPTQERVKRNLDTLICTKVIIAHRFSTIENADFVLLLDDGKLSDFGTIAELEERSELFRRLKHQDIFELEM